MKIDSTFALLLDKFRYYFLFILFIIINCFLFYKTGIKIVNDSPRYLDYAENLKSGFYFDQHNFWYIGYVIYIAIIKTLYGNVIAIIAGQYILNFLASIALYQTAILLWNSKHAAWCVSLFFLFFFEIALWNAYILTESLYISFTCFSLYYLAKLYRERTVALGLTALCVVFFTSLIKPTGIALLGAVFSVLMIEVLKKINLLWLRYAVVGCVFVVFLMFVNRVLNTFGIESAYRSGEIIYDVSTVSNYPGLEFLTITPPDALYSPPEHYPQLLKLVLFFVHHPVYCFELFFAKVFYLVVHVRPYWSVFHNLFSIMVLLPLYFFFGKSMKDSKTVSTAPKVFAMVYLIIHILSIGLLTEDWDGRFLMPMLPVVFLFAANGLVLSLKRF